MKTQREIELEELVRELLYLQEHPTMPHYQHQRRAAEAKAKALALLQQSDPHKEVAA